MKASFVLQATGREGQGLPAFQLENVYPALEGAEMQGFARQGPALLQVPGTRDFLDLGSGAIRGLFQFPGAAGSELYAVAGTDLRRITSTATSTSIGTVSGTDPIIWDMIRDTLLFNADGKAWYTTGTSITQIVDADLGTVRAIAALDGRLLAAREGSDTFVWSDVLSPGVIPSLNFATAEGYGDDLQRILVYQRQIYLLGRRSAEIWTSTGDADTPFARLGGAVEPVGCAGRFSAASLGPLAFFVATNIFDASPFVAMLTPEFSRISDPNIEALLRSLSTDNLALVRGTAWMMDGASFYQLTMPGLGTWVCHVDSKTWFRRRAGRATVWHSAAYADAYGRHLVGSTTDGKIREMHKDEVTDAGLPIRRIATAYLPAERPTPIDTLVLDGKARDGSGPFIADIEISRDDGDNWSAPRTVPIDGRRERAPLTCMWGAIRRPGALVRVTVDGAFKAALYNLLVNEMAT